MRMNSPTQKRELLRCPRRYFYRYLYQPNGADEAIAHLARGKLWGIRELGGHLIHGALAEMVRDMAKRTYHLSDNPSRWNPDRAAQVCLSKFDSIIRSSLKTGPGSFTDGKQLAETYNGLTYEDIAPEISYWRGVIPRALANGEKAANEIRIPAANSVVKVEAEKVIVWQSPEKRRRYVFDVLISSQYRSTIIDWKCHSIDNQDIDQIWHYLRYLHRIERRDCSLFGRAVDLLTGEIVDVIYNPHPPSDEASSAVHVARLVHGDKKTVSFEPSPSPALCSRCPYSDLCEASATNLRSMAA